MPFSRDSSNYLNHNKKLIASSLPSARFLQVQSPNKQTAFKVNRDSLQEWGNVNTQTGSNDPSASYSVQSLTPCDSKQMTNYPSIALNSCLLSPPQPHCPPLTFPNTVLLHWTSMNQSNHDQSNHCVPSWSLQRFLFNCGSPSPNTCPDAKEFCLFHAILWNRKWQATSVFLPGKFHGWRSLAGYRPWGPKEPDTTEHAHILFFLPPLQMLWIRFITFMVCPKQK